MTIPMTLGPAELRIAAGLFLMAKFNIPAHQIGEVKISKGRKADDVRVEVEVDLEKKPEAVAA